MPEAVAESRAVIINTPGFEPLVDALIESAGRSDLVVVEAAAGLAGRTPQVGETAAGADDPVRAAARSIPTSGSIPSR